MGEQLNRAGLQVVNLISEGTSHGVRGETHSSFGYGGYFINHSGGRALRLEGGGIESDQASVVWISGNGVRPYKHDDSTIIDMTDRGSAVVRRGASSGSKYVMLPVTVPVVLFGENIRLRALDITWKGQTGAEEVVAVILRKQEGICSTCYVSLVFDQPGQACTDAEGCTMHYDIVADNVLTETAGPLYLAIGLAFANADNWIEIGGARLTLGHW